MCIKTELWWVSIKQVRLLTLIYFAIHAQYEVQNSPLLSCIVRVRVIVRVRAIKLLSSEPLRDPCMHRDYQKASWYVHSDNFLITVKQRRHTIDVPGTLLTQELSEPISDLYAYAQDTKDHADGWDRRIRGLTHSGYIYPQCSRARMHRCSCWCHPRMNLRSHRDWSRTQELLLKKLSSY